MSPSYPHRKPTRSSAHVTFGSRSQLILRPAPRRTWGECSPLSMRICSSPRYRACSRTCTPAFFDKFSQPSSSSSTPRSRTQSSHPLARAGWSSVSDMPNLGRFKYSSVCESISSRPTYAPSDPPSPWRILACLSNRDPRVQDHAYGLCAHQYYSTWYVSTQTRMAARELTLLWQPLCHTQHNRLRVLAPCPCASTHHPGLAGSNLRIPLLADPNIPVARSTEDSLVKDKGVMFRVRYLIIPVSGL